MKRDQERRRFVCNTSFSNGRLLGGHMGLTKGKKKIEKDKVGSEGYDESGYVLRENPKKSWKFSGSGVDSSGPDGGSTVQAHLCQVCGKGFETPRALFGHLRHHTSRERNSIHCTECGKGFGTARALTGHMRWHPERVKVNNVTEPEESPCSSQELHEDSLSDNDKSGPVRKKRSKRVMRFKNFSNSSSFSDLNESSSVTGTEQELEDVAMCLMMLSRGVRDWADYVSVCEFSENNFEVNEAGDESFNVKVASCVSKSVNVVCGKRKAKFCENGSGFEFKRPKLESGYEVERKIQSQVEEDLAGLQSVKLSSMSKQYKCRICDMSFSSHQALGGHCNLHKGIKSCSNLKVANCSKDTQISLSSDCKLVDYECDETSEEQEISSNEVKKLKVHECPVCLRVFRSGQALGGHKRAHFFKGAEIDNKEEQDTELDQHPFEDIKETFSLKASVDAEDEANANVDAGFKQWWVGSNYSHEALVGV